MVVRVRRDSVADQPVPVSGQTALDLNESYEPTAPAVFEGTCLGLGDGVFLIRGTLAFSANTLCARCIKPVCVSISIPFEERFVRAGSAGDDGELYAFEGDEIDLTEALDEAAIMGLPFRVLCDEDCKGLCPVCGADKNVGNCDCITHENAFAVLSKLDLP